jgi:hypothetical protein
MADTIGLQWNTAIQTGKNIGAAWDSHIDSTKQPTALNWNMTFVPKLNANALVDLAGIKNHLDIPDGYQENAKIIEAVNMASQYIIDETGKDFFPKNYSQFCASVNRETTFVLRTPLLNVFSVETRTYPHGSWTLVPATDYEFSPDGEIALLTGRFPTTDRSIRVVYRAGYLSIPSDIRYACMVLAEFYYRVSKDRRIGQTSRGKQGESIGYSQEVPAYISALWEGYNTYASLWDAAYLKEVE